METTKKTSTTKAALLVLAALSMLLSGLFIATASSSDAQATCPAGFTLSADGANCSQPSANTTLDLGNTCATGFLSPDGANCWIAATSTDQAGTATCPAGFSFTGGVCTASASATATVSADACPAGASGTAGACYNVVAATSTTAATDCADFGGTLTALGCQAVVGTAIPTTECSVISTGWTTGDTDCTSTTAINTDDSCDVGVPTDTDTDTVLDACVATGAITDVSPAVLTCVVTVGSALFGTDCVEYGAPTTYDPVSACAAGTTAIPAGGCYSPVANATPTTTYTCATGSLNVTDATPVVATCDSSSGFDATLGGVLYMCDAGTPAVVGTAVLCDLGAATSGVVTGPACLNGGVLSADEASCVVPATVTVAAPVPAFTG